MTKYKLEFNTYRKSVDEHLDKYVKVVYPEKIYESMRYSVLAGGKRLRPVMAIESAIISGADIAQIMPTACAVEMLHCQSLIHDDLPCMDDDDLRRGKPSNHKVFGEAVAVLAGDALLSYAPKIIIDETPDSVSSENKLKLIREFFIAAGVDGIISGQVADIEAENKQITSDELYFIHEYKTAKLFEFALRTGPVVAGADENLLNTLTDFSRAFGHAFQIYDDILDVTSTPEQLGKTPGKDLKAGKATYVSMFGEQASKKQVLFLCDKACGILNDNNIDSDILSGVVKDIVEGINKCS